MIFHLVLELKPKDFMPIDINILSGVKESFHTLESIDTFTRMFTIDQIYNMIRENNIVPDEYLNGTLKIINDKKYRFPVLTKDNTFTFDNYFSANINNKIEMNKFINIYHKYNNDTEYLKKLINDKNINEIIRTILSLPYEDARKIYFYLESN